MFQDELFDDVIGHEFGAVHDGVASDVRQTTWKTKTEKKSINVDIFALEHISLHTIFQYSFFEPNNQPCFSRDLKVCKVVGLSSIY